MGTPTPGDSLCTWRSAHSLTTHQSSSEAGSTAPFTNGRQCTSGSGIGRKICTRRQQHNQPCPKSICVHCTIHTTTCSYTNNRE